MIRAILTDVGGVMLTIDANAAFRELGTLYGVPPETMGQHVIYGGAMFHELERGRASLEELVAHLNGMFGRVVTPEEVDRTMNRMLIGTVWSVVGLWGRLRRAGVLIASASNVTAGQHACIQERFPTILDALDLVGASHLLGHRKGDAEFFPEILVRLNRLAQGRGMRDAIGPHQCLFVDDLPENVQAARTHGINTILFRYDGEDSVRRLEAALVENGIDCA